MTEHCTRCGAKLPNFPTANGFRYLASLERSTHNVLHFAYWRFNGHMNGDSVTTRFELCDACAVDVMLYAQGEEPK